MVSHLLKSNKFYPTIVNGGIINSINSNASLGKGEWSVVEADESDGSFLKFKSIYSVVSNIDIEHLDYYKNFENLKKSFEYFLNKTPLLGKNIVCVDDKNIKFLLKKIKKKNFLTYGFSNGANLQCKNVKNIKMGMEFDINVNLPQKKIAIKKININLLGVHNVLNVVAAVAIGLLLNINIKQIKSSLSSFSGVQRRLTIVYKSKGTIIYDDYAHHPTEIKAVLKACRNNFKNKKIIAIFQLHRFSRITSLYQHFIKSFNDANQVIVCPVFAAGEKNKKFSLNKFCRDIILNSKTEVVQVDNKNQIDVYLKKST